MSYESLVRSGFPDMHRPEAAVYYVRRPSNIRQRFQRIVLPYPQKPTIEQIAATDNLMRVFYELKARGGQAPGPDGFTYTDWGRREVASILRELSAAVCAGQYRPQASRCVPIPKASGACVLCALPTCAIVSWRQRCTRPWNVFGSRSSCLARWVSDRAVVCCACWPNSNGS